MFEKFKLEKEWRLYREEEWGRPTHLIVEIIDDTENVEIALNSNRIDFRISGSFYGWAPESYLTSAHVVPGKLLEFELSCKLDMGCKYEITIKKEDSDSYSITIYSPKYESRHMFIPETNISEILSRDQLNTKLSCLIATFSVYPFLDLPFGNCFT